jgi:hypothetical protein
MTVRPIASTERLLRQDGGQSPPAAPGGFKLLVGQLGGEGTKPPAGSGKVSDQTWLWMLREQGASIGEAKLAKAVQRGRDGFGIVDGADLSRALKLRDDPLIAGRLERAFAAADAIRLETARLRSAAGPGLVEAHAAVGSAADPAKPAAPSVAQASVAEPKSPAPALSLAAKTPFLTLLAHGLGDPGRQRAAWTSGDESGGFRLRPPGLSL